MKILVLTACLICASSLLSQDCVFSSDYSNPAQWTQVGTLVEVNNGVLNFINGAPDGSIGSTAVGSQRRVYAPIGTTFDFDDLWTAEVEFTPQLLGEQNGHPHTGHTILALTAGTQEPFNNCSDLPCTGYPTGTQDGIILYYGTDNPPNGNVFFGIRCKDGATETGSLLINNTTLNNTFYIRLDKVNQTQLELSIYSDANYSAHVPGSPISFSIPTTVNGLNTVQQGNQVRGQVERELTGFIDNLCIRVPQVTEECLFESDFSTPSQYQQVGSLVEINNGLLNFINGAPDGSIGSTAVGSQRRVYAPIGTSLDFDDTWRSRVEFTPQLLGEQNGQPHTGHTIIAFTAGTQEPFNNCPDLACTGYPIGNQDGLIIYYGTDNPPNGNIFFGVRAKDGTSETGSPLISNTTIGSTFYVEFERLSPTQSELSIFDDASFSNHVAGSPVQFTIPSTLTGLSYVQHGNQVRGQVERELTGYIDNVCIVQFNNLSFSENESESEFQIYPNPSNGEVFIKSNGLLQGEVSVLDAWGRIVNQSSIAESSSISLLDEPAGVYLVIIVTAETTKSYKVVKY